MSRDGERASSGPETPRMRRPALVALAWTLLVAAVLGIGLGERALVEPDEGRNASVALEMARGGDLLFPRLDGLPFLDKPFLYFAAQALSIRLLGASETAVRLPSLISIWLMVGLVAWFARRLPGWGPPWIAATACASAPLALVFARTAIFDGLLALWAAIALISFYRCVEAGEHPSGGLGRLGWCRIGWLAMALGILTKGPIALLLPLLVAGPYAALRGRFRRLWSPTGPLLLLALVLPWALLVETRIPGFLRYALVTESWRRLTTDEFNRSGPIWYFVPILLLGTFPWLLLVIRRRSRDRANAAGAQRPGGGRPVLFLALWILIPFLFFSLSQSKRPQYLLPLVPAVALLAARRIPDRGLPVLGTRAAAGGWIGLGGALLVLASMAPEPTSRSMAGLGGELVDFSLRMGLVGLACGLLAWGLARRSRTAVAALAVPALLLPTLAGPIVAEVSERRSTRRLAESLEAAGLGELAVVGIEILPLSLPFYLDRPITLSDSTPKDLTSKAILEFYPDPASGDAPTLRPADWWLEALERCPRPLLFALPEGLEGPRAGLERAGLPRLFGSERVAVYGPSRPSRRRRATRQESCPPVDWKNASARSPTRDPG